MIQHNNSDGTQPNKTVTQPNTPSTKPKRSRNFLTNTLILVAVLAIALFGGYRSGIGERQQARSNVINQQLGEQFQNTLVDMQFGRYEIAKQRLDWIIKNDPDFPGARDKLTEVLVLMNVPTPTITPSLTPTPDFTGAQDAFSRAQQYTAAQDWPNALSALDELRKLDSTYNTSQVDGMYYFALRNQGYDLITKQGNLEGGIYYLTLADRFGILDRDANGIREGARFYILGASFWEINWEQAVFYFDQVNRGWSGIWDGTMTASERYRIASMRYGDVLYERERYCDAIVQYNNASRVGNLDQTASHNYSEAFPICNPPTATPVLFTSTPDGGSPAPTDTPAPTATP